jgi:hypothetical protein
MRSVAWICVLLVALATAHAQAPAVLEPAAPQLGERATLRLAETPVDSTHWPRSFGAILRATPDAQVFDVVVTRVGEAFVVLPATGDTLRWSLQPRLTAASPDSLRPWVRVGDLGPNWWPTLALAVAILAPLIWWARRLLRPQDAETEPVFAEPAHVLALRQLDELVAKGWIAAGRFDEFYVEASHALRAYVSGRFGVPALDWTTEETLDRLLAAGHDRIRVAPIDPLLRAADIVKFAAQRPSEHQAEQWLVRAREWIEGTAVEPVYSTPEALRAAARLRPPSRGARR